MKQATSRTPKNVWDRRNTKKDVPFKYSGAKLDRKAREGKLTLRG